MDLFSSALCFAARKHDGQHRKFSDAPYILHPLEVAQIVSTMTSDQEILSAALLHDTVEDTDATIDEIRELFGPRVAALVSSETEDKRADLPPEATWQIRKQESLLHLAQTDDPAVRMLWLGDKLSNMRGIALQHRTMGDALWQRFHQHDPAMHEWYYRSVAACLASLAPYEAYRELMHHIDELFPATKK